MRAHHLVVILWFLPHSRQHNFSFLLPHSLALLLGVFTPPPTPCYAILPPASDPLGARESLHFLLPPSYSKEGRVQATHLILGESHTTALGCTAFLSLSESIPVPGTALQSPEMQVEKMERCSDLQRLIYHQQGSRVNLQVEYYFCGARG